MHRRDQVFRDRCHSLEIERVHGVGVLVVVGISEEGGIGEHQGGEAFVPVAEVVGEAHFGHDEWKCRHWAVGECRIEAGEELS